MSEIITISNDVIEAKFTTKGAELISLKNMSVQAVAQPVLMVIRIIKLVVQVLLWS